MIVHKIESWETMKKAIIIYGHRGAGKSTLAKELSIHLPNFVHFSIDEYRKRLNPRCSVDGERTASEQHDDDYQDAKYKLAESGGSNWLLYQFLQFRDHTLFIYVTCDRGLRLKRIKERESKPDWTPTPFPQSLGVEDDERIEKFMDQIFERVMPDLVLDSTKPTDQLVEETIKVCRQ
jgi:adenylate kinase family enzyme